MSPELQAFLVALPYLLKLIPGLADFIRLLLQGNDGASPLITEVYRVLDGGPELDDLKEANRKLKERLNGQGPNP